MPMPKDSKSWKVYKLRQYTRRKTRPYYAIAMAVATTIGCIALVIDLAVGSPENDLSSHHISKRSSESTNDTSESPTSTVFEGTTFPDIGNYPKEIFTLKQLRQGAVLLHTGGMIYMFIALAIVCDEFFVPALEVITDRLKLTEDVAGATFMAAGGSAPELFTSIAGLFISQNSVGISTIIGSAVFNILFVIGACGLVARELLHLTWWPLFRDTCFYSLSLIILIISYLDWKIHFYEALLLLLVYALYVLFMRFNKKIEKIVKTSLCKQEPESTNIDLVPVSNDANLMFVRNGGERVNVSLQYQSRSRPASSLKFRAGLLQLMLHTIDPLAEGNIEEKATKLRSLATNKVPDKPGSPNSVDQNGNKNDNTTKSKKNGSARVHSAIGSTSSTHSAMTAVESVEGETSAQSSNNHTPTKNTRVETTAASNGCDVRVRTVTAAESQQTWDASGHHSEEEEEGDENAPLDISWPKTCRKRFTYVLLAPIIFPLWLTLPDTRREEKKKLFPITFIGSILWIAFFSIMMVWWASIICVTIGISVEMIGLTVLAAGTSVPDLLTSVIVARKGFGDMAISSSIGSNIFDITVGLPLPWLVGSLLKIPAPFVDVNAAGLLCSIMLLFAMLLIVVGTIAIFRWRLSKPLGIVYILLYFGFLAVSVLLGAEIIPCIEISFTS